MKETELNVMGMSCPSCIRHISDAVCALDGVKDVQVRIGDGVVVVQHGPEVQVPALVEAIREAGYEAEA